jgi:thymidylate synthase ThyX
MYVKVIADSVAKNGKRITTLECKYWRGIHAELMTHRAFARNAASSRAIPFLKTKEVKPGEGYTEAWAEGTPQEVLNNTAKWVTPIEKCNYSMIQKDPFFPKYIGAEQKGMQSGDELEGEARLAVLRSIDRMRQFCLAECKIMFDHGAHKSIINRYLEPFSYITTLITATEWKNFYALRIHPAAEKHFNELAVEMAVQMGKSVPVERELHLPYTDEQDHLAIRTMGDSDKFKVLEQISVARCSRLSYLTQDGVRDISKDLAQYDRLLNPGDGVMHASPFEHVARATLHNHTASGPFRGWLQHRKMFPQECVPG